jgi:CRP/FNR family cyclic AMP-dependent transcriptional regulator
MEVAMPLIPHPDLIEERLAALPLTTFQPGEVVLLTGSRTDQLFFLKEGTVAVVRDGVEIARVTQSNAVFGELSVLLDQPHMADVRVLETSQFHVADAEVLAAQDPILLIHVAAILAHRLDSITRTLIKMKTQDAEHSSSKSIEEALEIASGSLYERALRGDRRRPVGHRPPH